MRSLICSKPAEAGQWIAEGVLRGGAKAKAGSHSRLSQTYIPDAGPGKALLQIGSQCTTVSCVPPSAQVAVESLFSANCTDAGAPSTAFGDCTGHRSACVEKAVERWPCNVLQGLAAPAHHIVCPTQRLSCLSLRAPTILTPIAALPLPAQLWLLISLATMAAQHRWSGSRSECRCRLTAPRVLTTLC